MNKYSKILYISIVLVFWFLLTNFLYKAYFLQNDLVKYSPVKQLLDRIPAETQILYLSNSQHESNTNSFGEPSFWDWITNGFPSIHFSMIDQQHAGTNVYYDYLQHLEGATDLETIIIDLDLREFSIMEQYADHRSELQKSMVLLGAWPPLINKFRLVFKDYFHLNKQLRSEKIRNGLKSQSLNKTEKLPYNSTGEWDRAIARDGVYDSNNKRSDDLTSQASQLIKYYGYSLEKEHSAALNALEDIEKLLIKNNWNLIINIIPVDIALMNDLVGDNLVDVVRENLIVISKRFEGENIRIVYNIGVKQIQFEHLSADQSNEVLTNYMNRGNSSLFIALGRFYRDDYRKADLNLLRKSVYSYDCENELVLNEPAYYSGKYAFSGKYSSVVSAVTPYSVSFKNHLDIIPANHKNRVNIDCWVKGIEKSKEVKLVIDIEPDDPNNSRFWAGLNISDLVTEKMDNWSHIQYQYNNPEALTTKGMIKIYIWNSDTNPVYVDDINIEFQ
jgi:hypothetical protein